MSQVTISQRLKEQEEKVAAKIIADIRWRKDINQFAFRYLRYWASGVIDYHYIAINPSIYHILCVYYDVMITEKKIIPLEKSEPEKLETLREILKTHAKHLPKAEKYRFAKAIYSLNGTIEGNDQDPGSVPAEGDGL